MHQGPADASKSFFVLDREACILCGRCAVACDDVQQIGAIALLGRGHATKVGVARDGAMASSVCTSCGQCVATCPTGALRPKETPAPIVRRVETTCPYCGVGCGITLDVRADGRLAVMADDAPANGSSQGMLCVKGRFGTGFVHARDRIVAPRVRRDGRWQDVSWDEALDAAADGLARHHGRFGALASAKATNEDAYVIQKFVRAVMDTNNVDHCTRLCHSPSVEAMLVSMGSGATSNSYQDYEEAGCLMVVGADASANHPVIAIRFRRAMRRGAKIVVINPKRIELCDQADLWLQPRPGTDVMLFNAMARVIVDEGLADADFIAKRTEGVEAWKASLAEATLDRAAAVTGVPAEDIAQAARWYAEPPYAGSCLIWGMGITQHTNGLQNAHALLNLSLVAGQLGKPGGGISPLRGQNNVQGCGDSGCIPTSLPGYQSFAAPMLAKFEADWGIRPPAQPGRVVTEMVEAFLTGEIRAMYVVGENPLLSEPDLHHAEKAFAQLDFLVVQDLFLHETAERADVFLPAAAFAEKEGTFTNSERRVQRVRKAIDPAGQARPDWWITAELARRVAKKLGRDVGSQFAWRSASEVFDELARLTPFLGGLSHARLDREGGLQWPCPTRGSSGHAVSLRRDLPAGEGAVHPGAADRRGRRAAGSRVPVPPQHRPAALPLARRHAHAPRGGLARAGAAAGGGDPSERRAAPRRGHGVGAPRDVTARRAHGPRARHRGRASGRDLRAVREARRLRGQLPHERGARPRLEDPRVQGLRRARGAPARRLTAAPDRLRARLARRWTVTVEVVTPPPDDEPSRARILALADAVRDDDRVAALTLTDRTASPRRRSGRASRRRSWRAWIGRRWCTWRARAGTRRIWSRRSIAARPRESAACS